MKKYSNVALWIAVVISLASLAMLYRDVEALAGQQYRIVNLLGDVITSRLSGESEKLAALEAAVERLAQRADQAELVSQRLREVDVRAFEAVNTAKSARRSLDFTNENVDENRSAIGAVEAAVERLTQRADQFGQRLEEVDVRAFEAVNTAKSARRSLDFTNENADANRAGLGAVALVAGPPVLLFYGRLALMLTMAVGRLAWRLCRSAWQLARRVWQRPLVAQLST